MGCNANKKRRRRSAFTLKGWGFQTSKHSKQVQIYTVSWSGCADSTTAVTKQHVPADWYPADWYPADWYPADWYTADWYPADWYPTDWYPADWYPEQQNCKNLELSAFHSLLNLLAHLYEPVVHLTCLDLRHFLLQLQVHGLLLLHQSLQLIDPLCNTVSLETLKKALTGYNS